MKKKICVRDFSPPPGGGKGRSRLGVALVMTLAAVVLLTVLLLAFFSRAMLNRQISISGTNLVKTDVLAREAFNRVIGEVRQEICDTTHSTTTVFSTVLTNGATINTTIYNPLASTNALPIRDPAMASEANLLRISSKTPPAGSSALASSAVLSSEPSANNRFISDSRWNGIALRTNAVSAATTPCWILMTRTGPKSSVSLTDAGNPGSGDYVIGRYAYAIYDEGSLLDINVAGYPDSASPGAGKGQQKGPASFADLAAAGLTGTTGMTNPWANWRHPFAPNQAAYVTNVLDAATNGFTKVSATNNTFLSRRDAIAFAKANGLTNALPYLGTSLFEKNSPVIPAGTDPSLNPDFTKLISPLTGNPLQRFALSRFKLLEQDPSKLSAQDKASILKYFGLSPLAGASATYRAWQYRASTIGTPAAAIASGRDPDLFELVKGAIANGSLGAFCINNGMFYDSGGAVYSPETNVHQQVARIIANMIDQYDADNYPTTIVLGANPVANTVHGIEHLPYFSEIFIKIYYPSKDLSNNADAEGHMYFELWDPHQGAASTAPPCPGLTGPAVPAVRVMPTAKSRFFLDYLRAYNRTSNSTVDSASHYYAPNEYFLSVDPSNANGMNIGNLSKYCFDPVVNPLSSPLIAYTEDTGDQTRRIGSALTFGLSNTEVKFNSLSFSPYLRSSSNPVSHPQPSTPVVGGSFYNSTRSTTPPYYFLYLETGTPDGYSKGDLLDPPDHMPYWSNSIKFCMNTATFLLQYNDDPSGGMAGTWRTYSTFAGHENDDGVTGVNNAGAWLRDIIYADEKQSIHRGMVGSHYNPRIDLPNGSFPKPDPRTFRFRTGACTAWADTDAYKVTSAARVNAAMVFGADPGQVVDGSVPLGLGGWPNSNCGMLYKNSGTTFKLPDPDGTARVADGYLGSAPNPADPDLNNPMATGVTTARPVILNRPFRSVGELGYVFRDVPWKSLNLFSSDSGDAALMELFCMEEGDVVAGKTNPNTPHREVLQALVQGALRSDSDTASGVTSANATQVTGDLVAFTATMPLRGRHELVTKFAAYSGNATASAYPPIKTEREATVRALASATQTRTWNLLIDLVAQSGRYPANPAGLDKFTVEGEKHCWMHVAIDRYTGEILRTQLEVADE